MIKNILLMIVMALGLNASPLVGVQFGSGSGAFGNLYTTATGLGPSEVLTFKMDWSVDVDYPDGYLPDSTFTYAQSVNVGAAGSYGLGTFGRAQVGIGDGTFYSENLRYLHVTVTSNLGNFVQTFYIDPPSGASYVPLGPIRIVSPNEVPEPATLWGVGAGLVLLGLVGRNKR